MLYEVTGAPVVTIATSTSARVAIPPLRSFECLRVTADNKVYVAFGDNTVVADDDADSFPITELPNVEFIVPLAGATHVAFWGSATRVIMTPVRILVQ